MADYIYLNSDKIHIFPCANRTATSDIKSKLNTEDNLIHLPSLITNTSSYTLEKSGDKITFVLKGYYVVADFSTDSAESEISINNLWADLKTADSAISTNATTPTLCNYKDGSFVLDSDSDSKFYGVAFQNSEQTVSSWFQITDSSGNLVNSNPISIELKDVTNIFKNTEYTASESKGITVKLYQDNTDGTLNLSVTGSNVTADKLGSSTVGSNNEPIYLSGGEAKKCTTYFAKGADAGGNAEKANSLAVGAGAGSLVQPVYFNSDGKPDACTNKVNGLNTSGYVVTPTTSNPSDTEFEGYGTANFLVINDKWYNVIKVENPPSGTTPTEAETIKVGNKYYTLGKTYTGSGNISISGTAINTVANPVFKTSVTVGSNSNIVLTGSSGQVKATKFLATSDKRKKENIEDYKCEKSILDLPVKKFDFIDGAKNQIGCIAQDLQEICPEIVQEDENGYLAIQESKLVYLLLQEVKELKEEVNRLKRGE